MPYPIWKGAITVGLVHVPVAFYSAASESGADFDWIDRGSMDPVGYKRINKRTGRDMPKEEIVKGVRVQDGEYVILTNDEIKAAYPKTTQTIEIENRACSRGVATIVRTKCHFSSSRLENLVLGQRGWMAK